MRIVLDGQDLHSHPLVQSGSVELLECARFYPFTSVDEGQAGIDTNPETIAARIRPNLSDPYRSGMLHLKGFGTLSLEMNVDWGLGGDGKPIVGVSTDEMVEGFARGRLILHPRELQWASELSDGLGDTRPKSIHLDCEKYMNSHNIQNADPSFWAKLMGSKRAMSTLAAQAPELHALLTIENRDLAEERRFHVLWSRYARDLCAQALNDLLWQSGLTVPHGLVESVPVIAYLYYDGGADVLDENGVPIWTTTVDGTTSCYGFYGDNPKSARLLYRAASKASGGVGNFVPILDLSNDPSANAHRLEELDSLGVKTAILYSPMNHRACPRHLTTLHTLGVI